MARDLKKFVNPKFIRTADLGLLKRLLERHTDELAGFDVGLLDAEEPDCREKLQGFFAGPEDQYPEGLVADLHRIAELGNAGGLELLLEQANRQQVILLALDRARRSKEAAQEPKQVALRAFLDHPAVFEAASDMLAYRTVSSCAEFGGEEEGIDPDLDDSAVQAFQRKAAEIFEANLRGRYCRARCFEDGGDVNLVVAHGAPFRTTETLEAGEERVLSFRELHHAVLSYSPVTGRLKVAGVAKAQRTDIADAFAAEILQRPGFFSASGRPPWCPPSASVWLTFCCEPPAAAHSP